MTRDLLHSLRLLRKSPAFTITAMVTLALGIAGNATIFSIINAVLLKPLDYRDADSLVRISLSTPRRGVLDGAFAAQWYEEMRTGTRSLSSVGSYVLENFALSGNNEPEQLQGSRVSANFLNILGVAPILGRGFAPEEEAGGAPNVVLISEGLWRRRFGADAGIIGRSITLDSSPYTIIGVIPATFRFPLAGSDAWVTHVNQPSFLSPAQVQAGSGYLFGFGRLMAGATLEQARAELQVRNLGYIRSHAGNTDADPEGVIRLVRLRDQVVQDVRPALWILFGAVGFVLLIACANVASLLLARATSRSAEFAVRSALGASRGQLIRQLLVESLVLALGSGMAGVALARLALIAVARVNAANLPRVTEIRLDGTVLLFTLVVSVATGVLFSLVPSLKISRPDLASMLRERGAVSPTSRRRLLGLNMRSVLVVGQVAMSIVLLIGAALLIESFARLSRVDPGFQTAKLLTMQVALPPARYDTSRKTSAFFAELVHRVQILPGVQDAAVSTSLPTNGGLYIPIQIAEKPLVPIGQRPLGQAQSITPGYFHTMGIPLRRGRAFNEQDTADVPMVAMISETLARRNWPEYPGGLDPVGQHMLLGGAKPIGIEIVGIAADVHDAGLSTDPEPEMYLACSQRAFQTMSLIVHTSGNPKQMVNAVRAQVTSLDRDEPVSVIQTMDEVMDASVTQQKLVLVLLGIFAGLALALAVIGIYGVITYSVIQRTQEVGIRRALGAQQVDILKLVVGQGLGLAAAGVLVGLGGALALTRLISGLLFHVSPTDPATFSGIAILLVLAAAAASYVPARRAARTDPMKALR